MEDEPVPLRTLQRGLGLFDFRRQSKACLVRALQRADPMTQVDDVLVVD
jgi:hypothetical protein